MENNEEEILEEEFPTDDTDQEREAIFKESCPLPWVETVREFQDYLLDIGVRI